MKTISTGRVYVAYRGDVLGFDQEIFITNNVNGAFDFMPTFVTMNLTDDREPALSVQGASLHVAYVGQGGTPPSNQDYEVWYTDFQTPSQLTLNGSNEDSAPSLAVDSNSKAHVAFASIGGTGSAGDKEIWYAENTAGQWAVTQVSANAFEDTNPSI